MTQQEAEAYIEAEVQKRLQSLMVEQQQQLAEMMENVMKTAVKGLDQTNVELKTAQKKVEKKLDSVEKLRAKAEREGDKMADQYFANRQEHFKEAAQTELLRNLTRMHLEAGKTTRDIVAWLEVSKNFVENIQEVIERKQRYKAENATQIAIEGNPQLRYADYGRGGTIYYESADSNFDLWWEFATGGAMIILEVPTPERWEARTKLPLEQRENVLRFIGSQLVQDKNNGVGSFIIGENVMTFYA